MSLESLPGVEIVSQGYVKSCAWLCVLRSKSCSRAHLVLILSTGGEAESYKGITVTYVHGKTAVLTIYDNGKEVEKIVMHELKNKDAMHAMMRDKGFQLKFSPLVVTRSFTLIPGKNGTKWYHFLLAPLYSMGMIHATRKRKIVSWSVTTGVALIVAAVKRLPYPWRNIIDAGVVAGLTWGSLSMAIFYVKSWITGRPPVVDAALPEQKVA